LIQITKYWYKFFKINLMYVIHQTCVFFYPSTIKAQLYVFINPPWKERIKHIWRGALWFFFHLIFCLWMWHGTKNMGRCHKMVPNYIWHTCIFVYTTVLDLDYWIKIKMVVDEVVVNHLTSLPFVYILTIGLGWTI
jgi:hypothetical protein